MNVKKMITIGGAVLASILIAVGVGVMVTSNIKVKTSYKNSTALVNKFLSAIESGDTAEAYKAIGSSAQKWLSETEFKKFVDVYTDEDKVSFEIDQSRINEVGAEVEGKLKILKQFAENNNTGDNKEEVAVVQKMLDDISGREMTYVPVKRSYVRTVAGKKTTLSDEIIFAVVEGSESYKLYLEKQTFERLRAKYILGKAHALTVEAMEGVYDEALSSSNIAKIKDCISKATTINEEYFYKNRINVYLKVYESYVELLSKNYTGAVKKIDEAQNIAESDSDIIKVKEIMSEIYLSQGMYSEAANVLKEAVEIAPENEVLRVEYRSVNRLMIDKIESNLSRGWAQLLSVIKDTSEDGKKERNRMLSEVVMKDADAVIKVKEDLPDGYYLKGSIYYCLGNFSQAKSYLEQALSKTSPEDISLKTEIAQTLGLAKVSKTKTLDLASYRSMNPGQIRSLFIREININGILEAME